MAFKRTHLFWIIPLLIILIVAGYFYYRFTEFKKPYVVNIDTDFVIPGNDPKAQAKSTVYIVNPNDFDIKFDSAKYNLTIDGELYGEGKIEEAVNLKAFDTTAVDVPYSFNREKFSQNFEKTGKDSGFHKVEFDFFTTVLNKRIKIPYTWEKNSAVFKKPEVKIENVKLTKLGLKETELLVTVKLINPNDVQMLSDKITYSFSIEDKVIADGVVNKNEFLPKEGSITLEMPVKFSLKEAFNEIGLFKKKYEGKDYTLRLKAELKNTKGKNPPTYDFDIYKTGKMEELVEGIKEERKKKRAEKK